MNAYTDQNNGKNQELQLVSFCLGEEEYGVNILKVQEIIRMLSISKIPNAPEYVEGMINLRGKVIPIVNLRRRFGLERREINKQTRIVVVNISGKILGIVVDSVSEVLRLPASTIEPPPAVATGKGQEYIEGVGKTSERLLILLNLDKLFSDVEKEVMDLVGNEQQPPTAPQ